MRSGGGAGPVAVSLSAGVGQADVRFVTHGREGRPHVEDGRYFFTFSERFHGSACGVGSLDPLHPERGVRFEGTILFDYGDGLLRDDLAPHLFFDEESGQWRGWACNFSTGDAATGGRAPGGVNAVWSDVSPLRGLSVMHAKPLGLDGMNEDPCGIWDAEAGKWRLLVSSFTDRGIRARLLESDRWDGGFRQIAGPVAEDSTGTTIAELGGARRCLCGSADRAYRVYSYPSLEKVGALRMDPEPWGVSKGWPHGRGWPAVAPLPPGGPAGYLLLTMDRENFPGMPSPNWTYGALSLYVETPSHAPARGAAVGRIFEIREFTLHDGPGVRTTVFLKGCPLRCAWCHNPEGQSFEKETMRGRGGEARLCGEDWSAEALADELLRNADIMAQSGGGVTFSGGEPLAQAAFVAEVADRLKARGVPSALETSGHAPEADYRAVVSRMAFVYQDLKHHDADAFRRWCGGDLALVLRNLAWLRESGVPYAVRVPCIPGVNDAPADREALLRLAGPGTTVEFLPYNPAAPAKYPMLGREPPFRLSDARKKPVAESVPGIVVRGHGVASGRAGDPRFPHGTIAMQIPFFRALGLDLAGFHPGTMNVDCAPRRFRPGPGALLFERVKWHPAMPAETFSFARATLVRDGARYPAWIYWPHPETKPEHFQPGGVAEVIAPLVPGLAYGDRVALETTPDQAVWDAESVATAESSEPR